MPGKDDRWWRRLMLKEVAKHLQYYEQINFIQITKKTNTKYT